MVKSPTRRGSAAAGPDGAADNWHMVSWAAARLRASGSTGAGGA